jgi:hypothetical protein
MPPKDGSLERSNGGSYGGGGYSVSAYRRRGTKGALCFGIPSVPQSHYLTRTGQDGAQWRPAKASNTPCHDSPAIDKASPVTSCTSESPIMHRGGQGEKGGTGCKRRTGKAKAGTKAKRGSTATADYLLSAHSHPTPRVYPPTFCWARRSTVKNTLCRKISTKCKRENALSVFVYSNAPFGIRNGGLCIAGSTQARLSFNKDRP